VRRRANCNRVARGPRAGRVAMKLPAHAPRCAPLPTTSSPTPFAGALPLAGSRRRSVPASVSTRARAACSCPRASRTSSRNALRRLAGNDVPRRRRLALGRTFVARVAQVMRLLPARAFGDAAAAARRGRGRLSHRAPQPQHDREDSFPTRAARRTWTCRSLPARSSSVRAVSSICSRRTRSRARGRAATPRGRPRLRPVRIAASPRAL
jgi:hypothetical protein